MRFSRPYRVCSAFLIGALLTAVPASAFGKGYNIATNPNVVDKLVVGPGSLFFVGINPLRYPSWNISVNDKLVAGPTPVLQTAFSGNSVSFPDIDMTPLPTPSVRPDPNGLLPDDATPAPRPVTLGACDFGDGAPVDAATDCVKEVEREIRDLRISAGHGEDQIVAARRGYANLFAAAENVVHNAGTIETDAAFTKYRTDVQTKVVFLEDAFLQTVQSILPWPGDRVDEVGQKLDSADVFLKARFDKDTGQLIDFDSVLRQHEDDLKRLAGIQKLIAELRASRLIVPTYLSNDSAATQKRINDFASNDKLTHDLSFIRKTRAEITKRRAEVHNYDLKDPRAVAYKKKRDNLIDIALHRVKPATADRFGYSDKETCKGLGAGGRERTYVLALGDGRGAQVRIVCQSKMFVSAGFAFSGLAQQTFSTIPAPPTPMPVTMAAAGATPSPTPTAAPTPVILQATSKSKVRATAVVMNNVRLSESAAEGGGGLFASFGLGVSNGSSGTDLDYVGGLSWSISRTLLITVGAQFGKTVELPIGYYDGQILPAGTNPPQQLYRYTPKLFLGITFGKQ